MKGLAVGLVICAPIGPIGIICVRRTLVDGALAGFLSVLGASAADGLYCGVAGFGVTYVSNFLIQETTPLRIAGGVVLIFWGMRILFAPPAEAKGSSPPQKGLIGDFTSTFLFTLANFLSLLVYSAAFAALGVHGWQADYVSTGLLVLGVFCGSAAWAPILVTVVELFRPQLKPEQIRWVNRVSGSIIIGFGAVLEVITFLK